MTVACGLAKDDVDVVPAQPSFAADVKPIFDDHCNLCHGEKPNRGAPHNFRLDVYDNTDGRLGARAAAHEALEEIEDGAMPPAAAWGDGLGPKAKRVIQLWVEQDRAP